jgi:predicted GH43/DUF377 family glycosyl hydrolase
MSEQSASLERFLTDHSGIITHSDVVLRPNSARSVIRPFFPGDPPAYADPRMSRPQRIANRVLSLSEDQAGTLLQVLLDAARATPELAEEYLLGRFDDLNGREIERCSASHNQKQLLAAYFSAEYSFEAAALFNPSMIPHPEQPVLPDGRVRFLLSLRSVGEGHVSSVTFRTGSWGPEQGFEIEAPEELGIMLHLVRTGDDAEDDITHLASASETPISQTVIFPTTASQRQGIEDMRLVLFAGDDGTSEVFGTYTAFDGRDTRPELLHSTDLKNFTLRRLRGGFADSKGMALFPRKVGGRYLMLGRQDNENIWLLASDQIDVWQEGQRLLRPEQPWEFVQLGNCGSPLEIEEGWLVLTHGVGIGRVYTIAACLLDKADPFKVIARMRAPLLRPSQVGGGEGYVPNVVYSCGGMVVGRTLLLPFAVADSLTRFATVSIDGLLAAMD